jgi:predicted metal-dependent phosphoesterase TrpH
MAVQLGLKAIAITDHDTLSGSAAAIAGGIPPGLEFLTGIEISAAHPMGIGLTAVFIFSVMESIF